MSAAIYGYLQYTPPVNTPQTGTLGIGEYLLSSIERGCYVKPPAETRLPDLVAPVSVHSHIDIRIPGRLLIIDVEKATV